MDHVEVKGILSQWSNSQIKIRDILFKHMSAWGHTTFNENNFVSIQISAAFFPRNSNNWVSTD